MGMKEILAQMRDARIEILDWKQSGEIFEINFGIDGDSRVFTTFSSSASIAGVAYAWYVVEDYNTSTGNITVEDREISFENWFADFDRKEWLFRAVVKNQIDSVNRNAASIARECPEYVHFHQMNWMEQQFTWYAWAKRSQSAKSWFVDLVKFVHEAKPTSSTWKPNSFVKRFCEAKNASQAGGKATIVGRLFWLAPANYQVTIYEQIAV